MMVRDIHGKFAGTFESLKKNNQLADKNLSKMNLSRQDLSGLNLTNVDLSGALLHKTNFSCSNLFNAKMIYADLGYANLSRANLTSANLKESILWNANFYGAELCHANLRGAHLRYANLGNSRLLGAILDGANLHRATLRGANLVNASMILTDLSGAVGLKTASAFMNSNFLKDNLGYIVYKAIGDTYRSIPEHWTIEPGQFITENVNPDRSNACGCGVNVATLKWIRSTFGDSIRKNRTFIWKCRIRYEDLFDVIVPYNSDGKIRAARVEIIEKVL